MITRLNYEGDIRELIPTILVPTLVLHREEDHWADVGGARYLADHIPGASLRLLPGEDHIPFFGDQDDVVGAIEEFITGARGTASEERALLTVLMTDIANSTRTLGGMGDERWRAVLAQLDNVVGRRVEALGGQTVKHTGDGYLLVFSGPTRAIECARAINRDAEGLGLQLRSGIHTGERCGSRACLTHSREPLRLSRR